MFKIGDYVRTPTGEVCPVIEFYTSNYDEPTLMYKVETLLPGTPTVWYAESSLSLTTNWTVAERNEWLAIGDKIGRERRKIQKQLQELNNKEKELIDSFIAKWSNRRACAVSGCEGFFTDKTDICNVCGTDNYQLWLDQQGVI